jgi:hypothetical protein
MCHLCLPVVLWGGAPALVTTAITLANSETRVFSGTKNGHICLWNVAENGSVRDCRIYFCILFYLTFPFIVCSYLRSQF